jgi:hypothetical protein
MVEKVSFQVISYCLGYSGLEVSNTENPWPYFITLSCYEFYKYITSVYTTLTITTEIKRRVIERQSDYVKRK